MVNSCISKEFVKDEHALRVMKGRDPTAEERSDIHPLIREYDPLRKSIARVFQTMSTNRN